MRRNGFVPRENREFSPDERADEACVRSGAAIRFSLGGAWSYILSRSVVLVRDSIPAFIEQPWCSLPDQTKLNEPGKQAALDRLCVL